MDVVIAILVFLIGIAAIAFLIAWLVGRGARVEARRRAHSERATPWEVAEIGGVRLTGTASASGSRTGTRVVIQKKTQDGQLLDYIEVAIVPNGDKDWNERMIAARAEAAERAALLNTQA